MRQKVPKYVSPKMVAKLLKTLKVQKWSQKFDQFLENWNCYCICETKNFTKQCDISRRKSTYTESKKIVTKWLKPIISEVSSSIWKIGCTSVFCKLKILPKM